MSQRLIILALLVTAALGSTWIMNRIGQDESDIETDGEFQEPDYYMEDFTTLTMRGDGTPKHRLQALYMAHYPDDDTTELIDPTMKIFRVDSTPLYISADKGWVTANNEIVLLRGNVTMWEEGETGERIMDVNTSEVRVLTEEEYAETDKYATINKDRTTITGTGMRAHFKDSRLEIIDHERTVIKPKPNNT
ncbi:MAG: LPS export ABC transporter periplasmic protein LptC [Gammaproteobacteria bacterium]